MAALDVQRTFSMRFPLWFNLLVYGLACTPSAQAPSILRLEPAAVSVSDLPTPILVIGENLSARVDVRLNDSRLGVTKIRAVFGDDEDLEVDHFSQSQLRLLAPSDLTEGFYDLTLFVGMARLAFRASALEVTGSGVGPTDSADAGQREIAVSGPLPSSISHDAATPPGAGPRDGGASSPPNVSLDAATNGGKTDAAGAGGTVDAAGVDVAVDASGVDVAADAAGVDVAVDASGVDASVELAVDFERCGPAEFAAPQPVVIEGFTAGLPWSPSLSADGLTLFFGGVAPSREEIWSAARGAPDQPFRGATRVPSLQSNGSNGTPFISFDGLSLYIYSQRPGAAGSRDLYVAQRSNIGANFAPRELAELNSGGLDHMPWVSDDERQIVFVSQRGSTTSVWQSKRADKSLPFESPTRLDALSSAQSDGRVHITPNGRRAYFSSSRDGGRGSGDIWVATRASVDDEFSEPTNLGTLNTASLEADVTLARDGEELFFVRLTDRGGALYRAVANCP